MLISLPRREGFTITIQRVLTAPGHASQTTVEEGECRIQLRHWQMSGEESFPTERRRVSGAFIRVRRHRADELARSADGNWPGWKRFELPEQDMTLPRGGPGNKQHRSRGVGVKETQRTVVGIRERQRRVRLHSSGESQSALALCAAATCNQGKIRPATGCQAQNSTSERVGGRSQ